MIKKVSCDTFIFVIRFDNNEGDMKNMLTDEENEMFDLIEKEAAEAERKKGEINIYE